MRLFLDTSAFVALEDLDDASHRRALEFTEKGYAHLSGILSTVPVESKLLSLLTNSLSWDSSALARMRASKNVIECLVSMSCARPI